MGSRYTTQAASGYNSSAPADDGSQTGSNLVTWAGVKTKLADPIKTLAEAENTALLTAFDYSVRQITGSDSVAASDHMKTVEIAPTVSASVSVTLPDAATMTSNFIVRIRNSSTISQSITRATGADTIDGVAGVVTIPSKSSMTFTTNAAANGYLTVAESGGISKALIDAAGDIIYGTANDTPAKLALGTARQVLAVNAGATAPAWSDKISLQAEVATTSGTTASFTGIPAGVKRITIMFKGVSTNGTSNYTVQIGDAGGLENSGYLSRASNISASTGATTSFILTHSISNAADTVHGQIVLNLERASTFSWTCGGQLNIEGTTNGVQFCSGSKSLSEELTQLQISTVSGDTFDAGAISISYE